MLDPPPELKAPKALEAPEGAGGGANALLFGKPPPVANALVVVPNALLKAGLAAAAGYGFVKALKGLGASVEAPIENGEGFSELSGFLNAIVKAFGAELPPEMNGLEPGF